MLNRPLKCTVTHNYYLWSFVPFPKNTFKSSRSAPIVTDVLQCSHMLSAVASFCLCSYLIREQELNKSSLSSWGITAGGPEFEHQDNGDNIFGSEVHRPYWCLLIMYVIWWLDCQQQLDGPSQCGLHSRGDLVTLYNNTRNQVLRFVAKESFCLCPWCLLRALGLNINCSRILTTSRFCCSSARKVRPLKLCFFRFYFTRAFLLDKGQRLPSLGFPSKPFEDSSSLKITVILCFSYCQKVTLVWLPIDWAAITCIYLCFLRKRMQGKTHVYSTEAPRFTQE